MTLPSLINSIKDKHYHTALKKSYTILQQSISYMKANDEVLVGACASNDSKCLGKLFEKYMNFVNTKIGYAFRGELDSCWQGGFVSNDKELYYCGISPDGISYVFDMEYSAPSEAKLIAKIYIDTNNIKPPNIYGHDRYILFINNQGIITTEHGVYPNLCLYSTVNDSRNYACANLVLTNTK